MTCFFVIEMPHRLSYVLFPLAGDLINIVGRISSVVDTKTKAGTDILKIKIQVTKDAALEFAAWNPVRNNLLGEFVMGFRFFHSG